MASFTCVSSSSLQYPSTNSTAGLISVTIRASDSCIPTMPVPPGLNAAPRPPHAPAWAAACCGQAQGAGAPARRPAAPAAGVAPPLPPLLLGYPGTLARAAMVAEHPFSSGVGGHQIGALLDWLKDALDAVL